MTNTKFYTDEEHSCVLECTGNVTPQEGMKEITEEEAKELNAKINEERRELVSVDEKALGEKKLNARKVLMKKLNLTEEEINLIKLI